MLTKILNSFWLTLMKKTHSKKKMWGWIKRLIKLGLFIFKLINFFEGDGTS